MGAAATDDGRLPGLPGALCRHPVWPGWWFPQTREVAAAAQLACSRCPEAGPCLDWATAHDVREGVWGGVAFGPPR
jgi:hypothetical protein